MTLAGVPVGGRVVLAGDGVRVEATVVRAAANDSLPRVEWDARGVRLAAAVMADGRLTCVAVVVPRDGDATALRAMPEEPLPPAETWHLVLASGARVAVVCTPERDDEYGVVEWVARETPACLAGTGSTPERAVYAVLPAYRGVRAIDPPAALPTAALGRYARVVAAPGGGACLEWFTAAPPAALVTLPGLHGGAADPTWVTVSASDLRGGWTDEAEEIMAAPEPDPVAAERAAIVATMKSRAVEWVRGPYGKSASSALDAFADEIAARGTP